MGLPWVRLDTAFPRNPKLLALIAEREGHRAAFVWCCGLAYCGEQGTDGYIPSFALGQIHGRPKDAAILVAHRLWREQRGHTGWTYADWGEFQQSSAETQARKERATTAALKANCKRWHDPECTCYLSDSDPIRSPPSDPVGHPNGIARRNPVSDPTDGRTD